MSFAGSCWMSAICHHHRQDALDLGQQHFPLTDVPIWEREIGVVSHLIKDDLGAVFDFVVLGEERDVLGDNVFSLLSG